MKCINCKFEDDCELKRIAYDLTGCDGHSELKPPREGYYQCCSCGGWFSEDNIFINKDGKSHLCFRCF